MSRAGRKAAGLGALGVGLRSSASRISGLSHRLPSDGFVARYLKPPRWARGEDLLRASATKGEADTMQVMGMDLRGFDLGIAEGAGEPNIGRTERWASVVGGGTLVLLGLSRRSLTGLGLAAVGGALVARGVTGYSSLYDRLDISTEKRRAARPTIEAAVTIQKPRDEIFRFLRDLENLPRVMRNVASVRWTGGGRTHWVVKTPEGACLEWDAQIVDERENEALRWRSLEGSEIEHQAEIRLLTAPGNRGTELHLGWRATEERTPGGKLFAPAIELYTKETLRQELGRIKQFLEAGEIATIESQPSGGKAVGLVRRRRSAIGRRPEPGRLAREARAEARTLH